MKDIIKVTKSYNGNHSDAFIVTKNIAYFNWSKNYSVSRIHFVGGGDSNVISVVETPEEILNLINSK